MPGKRAVGLGFNDADGTPNKSTGSMFDIYGYWTIFAVLRFLRRVTQVVNRARRSGPQGAEKKGYEEFARPLRERFTVT